MDGIEKIIERILADAEQESELALENARREAQEIASSFEKLSEQISCEILSRAKTDADEFIRKEAGSARQASHMATLSARQELINLAFEMALKKLTSLPEEEYIKLLSRLAFEASRTGGEQAVLNMSDRARFGKKIVIEANRLLEKAGRAASLTLSEQVRPIKGGLILSEGRIETNCSLELLVRDAHQSSAREVSDILFN